MVRPIIYPYKMGSRSSRALKDSLSDLRSLRVYPDRNYHPLRNHLIINWGNSTPPNWDISCIRATRWLNKPLCIADASDKLRAFAIMKEAGVSIPEFTTSPDVAREWLGIGKTVLARQQLKGHSGNGIVVCTTPDDFVDAPLYTMYIPKAEEYRIHVFGGKVIDRQMKKVKEGSVGNNFTVRNHANGWVFCREGVVAPIDVLKESIKAVESLGLDFGAVDVGWNISRELATVYEVNSAPGLEGTTLERYSEAIRSIL